ncbi:hypothetical protein D3C86_1413400 [compost metagenome]
MHDERGHALGAGVAISLGQQDTDIGLVGHRGPHLLASNSVDIAVALGEGLHVALGVGAAARFGERHHADGLTGDQVRHVLLDLFRRAAEIDRARTGGSLLVVTGGKAHVIAHHLFLDHRCGQVAHVAAAHGLGKHRTVESRLPGLTY